jgi:hypothetical protein
VAFAGSDWHNRMVPWASSAGPSAALERISTLPFVSRAAQLPQ